MENKSMEEIIILLWLIVSLLAFEFGAISLGYFALAVIIFKAAAKFYLGYLENKHGK